MKVSNRKRVLVTGGAGFLGSHLCDRSLKDGDDVLCIDNFYSGSEMIEHCKIDKLQHKRKIYDW